MALRQKMVTGRVRLIASLVVLITIIVFAYLPSICLVVFKLGWIDAKVGGVKFELAEGWTPGFSSESFFGRLLFQYPNSTYLILMKIDGLKPGYSELLMVGEMDRLEYDKVAQSSSFSMRTDWGQVVFVNPYPPSKYFGGFLRERNLLLLAVNPESIKGIKSISDE